MQLGLLNATSGYIVHEFAGFHRNEQREKQSSFYSVSQLKIRIFFSFIAGLLYDEVTGYQPKKD